MLRGVEFGYRDGAPLLRGFDLELEHGERVTLVGPNGAGKTTVAALLLGLYRPWRGRLEADGVAYDELDVRALRRLIGYVPQQPILLPGTVAENIAYGSTRDDARTREAASLPSPTTSAMARWSATKASSSPEASVTHRDRTRAGNAAPGADPRRADQQPRPRDRLAHPREPPRACERPGGAAHLTIPP